MATKLSSEVTATTVLPPPSIGDPSLNENSNVVIPWTNNDDSSDGGIDVERATVESPDLHLDCNGDADATNGPDFTNNGASTTNGPDGEAGEALEFNSSENDYLSNDTFGGALNLSDASGVTIAVAVRKRNEPQKSTLFRANTASGGRLLSSHAPWSNGNIYWDVGNDGSDYGRVFTSLPSEYRSGWHLFLYWYDPSQSEARIYLDGSQFASSNISMPLQDIAEFNIGGTGGGSSIDGDIAGFSLWKRPLSESEISSLELTNVADLPRSWTTVASDLSPATESYTDTTVSEGTTYDYRIERNTDHATATSNIESVTTLLQRAVSVSGTGATDSSRTTTESRSASVSATILVSQSARKTNKPRASSVSGSPGEKAASRTIQKPRQNTVYASGATSSNRSTSKQRSESIHTDTLANLASRQTIEPRSQTTVGSGASSATRATSRTRSFSSHGSGALTNAAELLEVFPSESSADLDFDMVFSPILGFASEWVEEETVFDGETAAYTTILDINITKPISVYIQYDSDGDGNPDYTAGPRKIKRDDQVISVDELGEDGYYRIIISNMRPPDHLRAITWGPTRF